MMGRRTFLKTGAGAAAGLVAGAPAALPFQNEKSKLKIAGVRLAHTRPKRPRAGVPAGPRVVVDRRRGSGQPMSIPGVQGAALALPARSGKLGGFTVEISTDKGVKGYGSGGPAGGAVVMGHFTKLLIDEDPFNVERIWDILWRSSMSLWAGGRGASTPSAAWTWRFGI